MSTLAYWLMLKTSSLWGLKDRETRVAYAYIEVSFSIRKESTLEGPAPSGKK